MGAASRPTPPQSTQQLHLSPCPPAPPLTSAVPSGCAGDSPTVAATHSGALARPAACPGPLCPPPHRPGRLVPPAHPAVASHPPAVCTRPHVASGCLLCGLLLEPKLQAVHTGRPSTGAGGLSRSFLLGAPAPRLVLLRWGGPSHSLPRTPQHRCPSPGVPVLVPTGPSPPAARLSWCPALPTPVVQPVVQWLVPLPPHPQFPTCDHVPLLPGSQCDLAPLPRVAPGSPSWATETSPSSEGLSLATCSFLEGVLFPWGRARLDKVGDLGVGRRVTGHPQERRDCHSGGTVCTGQLQVPCPAPRQTAAWWPPLEKPLPGSDHSLLPGHRADGSWVLIPGRETTSPAFWAAGHSQGIRFGQVDMSSVCCWRRSRGGSSGHG